MKNIFKKRTFKPFSKLTFGRKCLVCLVSGILLVLLVLTSYAFYYRNRVLPNTTISGIKVGGLTKSGLELKTASSSDSFLNQSLKMQYQDKNWEVKLADFGTSVSFEGAVDGAYSYGRTGSFSSQLIDLLAAPITKQNFDVDIKTFSDDGLAVFQKNILGEIEKPYLETSVNIVPGKVTIKPGQKGLELNLSKYEQDLFGLYKRGGDLVVLELTSKEPLVTTDEAEPARKQVEDILSKDWKVVSGDKSLVIPTRDLAKWIKVSALVDGSALAVSLDDTLLNKAMADFAKTVDKKAVNARVKVDGGKLVIDKAGTDGSQLSQAKLATALKGEMLGLVSSGMDYSVALDPEVIAPEVSLATLDSLGLKELVGTATTDYSGSPTNRKVNIDVGQKSLSGILVGSGDVFSTTTLLGVVDETTGYLPELVIKNNRTVPEYGGGLCQVSTTLFRAVLNAGLPITERTNHSYRVGYYERGVGPGLDATVYIPSPDLKWKNDFGSAVLVQAFIKDNKVTFEIFGTKDGRVSTISAPTILEDIPVGSPIYTETDTLYKDEKKQIETAHNGAKTEVTYTVARDGKQIAKQIFKSYYKPWPAQYLVGTKERPVVAPEATPAP